MGQPHKLELRRDRPEWRRFLVPSLGAAGQPVRQYAYRVPEETGDGWLTGSLRAAGLSEEHVSRLGQAILDGQYPQAHSVLIARDQQLVFEEYFYGHESQRRHGLQSATKSITSILVGVAIDLGAIEGVDQPVYTFFPERRGCRWIDERHNVTLRHLLTMTAALDWNEQLPYTDPLNDNTAMNMSGDWVGYVLDRGLAGTPGERYMYCSGLSILLGAIVHSATGQYVDEFAAEHLFGPLGITDYRWSAAPDGTRHTGGGLSLRPRDAAKIGAMMLGGGVWRGRRILSEGWVRESTRQQTRPGDYAYGYQWHLHAFTVAGSAVPCCCAAGYGGQWLFLFPSLDLEVVFTAGAYGGDSRPYEKVERYILPALV
jgi:CubicO group peptidase (beta-lactamase class C family)